MLYLVTGASGLVGSNLVRRLVADGHAVRGFVRPGSRLDLLEGFLDRVQVFEGDLLDAGAVAEAMEGVTHVFHCAAHVGFPGPRGAEEMNRVNVVATAHVVNAALRAGVRRLVHTSSVAALGRPEREEGCLDESAVWSSSRYNTVYGRSKYLAELEIARGVAEGLDAVIVNPSLVFGRALSGENTWAIVERVRARRLPGYPAGGTNVVDVEDLVQGHLLAMEKGICGERYILAGEFLPWKEILATLAAASSVAPPARLLSPALLTAAGFLSEWAARLLSFNPRITRESARVSSRSTCFSSGRAVFELGWTHRPFRDTAARLAALCFAFVALVGCQPPDKSSTTGEKPVFAATFHAVATIAREVAGDRADVVTLLEPGVSPHAYEPRPSDLRRFQGVTATVYAAQGLDSWLVDLGVPAPFELLANVPDSLRAVTAGVTDPHFWLSPAAVAETLPGLARHFCSADPGGCDGYESRAQVFADTLHALDSRLSARLAPARDASVVVASSFLRYFLDRYGPSTAAIVELVEGVEPSPSHLQRVSRSASRALAVVGQPWLPESASRAVAEAANVPYISVDPLGNERDTPTYAALLTRIADVLDEATRDR